jgi:hypothetical protein
LPKGCKPAPYSPPDLAEVHNLRKCAEIMNFMNFASNVEANQGEGRALNRHDEVIH